MKDKLNILWYFVKDGLLCAVILAFMGLLSFFVISFELAWLNILVGVVMTVISMLVYIKIAMGAGEAAYKRMNKLMVAQAKKTAVDKAAAYKWYKGFLLTAVIYFPAVVLIILAVAFKNALLRFAACLAYLPAVVTLMGAGVAGMGEQQYAWLLYAHLPVVIVYAAVFAFFYFVGARRQRLVYKMISDDMREYGG